MASSGIISKATAERHQRILLELLKQPGNDVCADCSTRHPRWASWNLGIFICVKCAGVHRNLGTHITKVKSLTLDSWTREQVQCMKQFGNIKSNRIYNPNDTKNPPPTDLVESERDSQLEKYIRMKYVSKRFMEPPRRNESIGSCSASASSGVSFTMSNSPIHSPASSIYQQSSIKSFPLPLRSPSVVATTTSESQPPRPGEKSTMGAGQMAPNTGTLDSSQFKAQFQPDSVPMASQDFKSHAPPLRASTAPIPSDGPMNSQSTALPAMPSLYHSAGYNNLQTTQSGKHESIPSLSHPIQPSLDIHTYGNQPIQTIHNPPAQPPRSDGVWGDLMQLAEPTSSNAYTTFSGSHGSSTTPTWNSNLHNVTNPYQQYSNSSNFSAGKINNLESGGMGMLMNKSSLTQVSSGTNRVGISSRHLGSNNPFSSQIRRVHSASGTFQSFPAVQSNSVVANSFAGLAGSSSQLSNSFMTPQQFGLNSHSSSANFNPKQTDLSPSSHSRNPFLNPPNHLNLNHNASAHLDQFGNLLPSSSNHHLLLSQPPNLSAHHHNSTPFF